MMKGFVTAFDKKEGRSQKTAYEILKTMIADSPDASEVFLTGHSLGGAIAVVFAMLLSARQASNAVWRSRLLGCNSPYAAHF